MSNTLDGRLTLSVEEAAELLGVARQTLYNQISAGCCPVPTFKLGRRRLVRVADLVVLTGATIGGDAQSHQRVRRTPQPR